MNLNGYSPKNEAEELLLHLQKLLIYYLNKQKQSHKKIWNSKSTSSETFSFDTDL